MTERDLRATTAAAPEPPRVVMIGCGSIGRRMHLPALVRLRDEGLARIAVTDLDPARAAAVGAEHGVDVVDDWRDAVAELDAAVVCTPPGPSAEIAIDAVERGLHVFCEKPPGRDVTQADRMATAAASRPDLVTMVGFNRRYIPVVQGAMERSSAIAPPTSFSGRFSRMGLGEAPSNTATDWITSDSIHTLDLAVAVMGFPNAVGVTRRAVGGVLDNVWTLQLHGDSGSALVLFNYAAGARLELAEWSGPGYDVRIEIPGGGVWGAQRTWEPLPADAADEPEALGFVAEHRAFLDAVSGRRPRPACDFAHGADIMRLVATILSAESGAVLPVARTEATSAAVETPRVGTARRATGRPVVSIHQPPAAQARYFTPQALAELATVCEVRAVAADTELAPQLEGSTALITGRGAPPLGGGALDDARDLDLVVVLGSSVTYLEPAALIERGTMVCSTADTVAMGVAEHCLMVTLAGLRNLTRVDAAMHQGRWGLTGPPARSARPTPKARLLAAARSVVPVAAKQRLYRRSETVRRNAASPAAASSASRASDLHGSVVGLLGWGHVARHFTRLLRPFGCTVLVWSESADPEELRAVGARSASLPEILSGARVISLHRGLTDATRGFLDAERLAMIRPGAVLVNTARGPLIDETALLDRLRRGDIVAALDVFDEEPLPPDHPLRGLPNTILTPHSSGSTEQELPRLGAQAVQYVMAWARGEPVPAVDLGRLAQMT